MKKTFQCVYYGTNQLMLFHVDIKTQADARPDRLLREQHDAAPRVENTNTR